MDEGRVRVLAFDRPEKLNAMSVDTAVALTRALRSAASDRALGAVVLTGVGGNFSAGGDVRSILDTIADTDGFAEDGLMSAFHDVLTEIWSSRLPVVAAVSGVAYGAAFNLAMACDLVICSTDARFCQVFVRRGVIPDVGAAYLLPRLIGARRAKDLMLRAPVVGAERALEIGLVNEVSGDAQSTLARAVELAAEIAEYDDFVIAMTKKAVNTSSDGSLQGALALESALQTAALRRSGATSGFAEFGVPQSPPEPDRPSVLPADHE
ncbi:enoyl-CoA hydratase/isomerase family protein [Rhodococcus sp. USK10]|uniref:enoyl-CoA hydratase/isomerase family protein n=1 Tax=Rhodococcus sp. USK10 TaxID=2789739 RepID=UPI00215142E3|nr:enoyl-CoA hydratase/isomerase family protein [Rhodococcus sp. USK10]